MPSLIWAGRLGAPLRTARVFSPNTPNTPCSASLRGVAGRDILNDLPCSGFCNHFNHSLALPTFGQRATPLAHVRGQTGTLVNGLSR